MKPTGYVDGVVRALEETRVPVSDRGFLYGDSVYEVLRTYAGAPFLFDEHYARLLNSAELIGLRIRQSKQEIMRAIRHTIAAAEAGAEDVYARFQITRGAGEMDLYPAPNLRSRLIVIVKQLPQWKPDFYTRGVKLAIPEVRRNAAAALNPNIKGGNYLNNILGLAAARALGADDCVMLGGDGLVTECSNSNIWFVLNGELATPAAGNLVGLTRTCLVKLLRAAGHRKVERDVHMTELPTATECFITSATREIMPVASLRLPDGRVCEFPAGGGERTRLAMRLYRRMLAEFVREQRSAAWVDAPAMNARGEML